jgi:hypothetical protein
MKKSKPLKQTGITTKNESNKGDYRGETEEEFYSRILKGTNQELDELLLGLLSMKGNLGEWLINKGFDLKKFESVINEVHGKLFAVDYFSWRIMDFQDPGEPMPHQAKREQIKTLLFYLEQLKPLVEQGEKFQRQAEPFINARKTVKIYGQEKEFLDWVKGKEIKIQKIIDKGRSKKEIILWMKNDGCQISDSAVYDYLKIHFPDSK